MSERLREVQKRLKEERRGILLEVLDGREDVPPPYEENAPRYSRESVGGLDGDGDEAPPPYGQDVAHMVQNVYAELD